MVSEEREEGFLQIPEGLPIHLIDSAADLDQHRHLVEEAAVCAIDVEWQPDTVPSSATLVQLAVRNAAGSTAALLLDMLALSLEESKPLLQDLLRNKSTLKVGYGLKGDLRAVSTAMGEAHGPNCIAVVQPALEIGSLQRLLLAKRVPGICKAKEGGLAAVVEAQLGQKLDKRLQCSAWGSRPLTPAQVHYAALDAICLLMLLDAFINLAPPQDHPINASAADADDSFPAESCPNGADESERITQDVSGGAEANLLDDQLPGDQGAHAAGLDALPADNAYAQAATAWGSRLELKKGQLTRRRKKLSKSARPKLRVEGQDGWPDIIPWASEIPSPPEAPDQEGEAGAQQPFIPPQIPKFACDVMVEGLARQLRLCGVDAVCPDAVPKRHRHLVHRWLVSKAEENERVVLTADRGFIAARLTTQAYFVQATTKAAQLEEVLQAFNILVTQDDLLSRCVKCNGNFLPEAVRGSDMPEATKPPQAVVDHHSTFWVCGTCGKAYWNVPQLRGWLSQQHAWLFA
ncbi:hypothetical protein WJX73_003555 [Symbiochloris irregularis]|uniref:3'-5' exonuclease domain-containing protein n=1 Tax=Symbiochloris irregularis TaxID=706552 RepID=A0AAW1PF32_9CHLO